MSGSNFRQILHVTSEDVERPRLLADGHYVGAITRHEFGTSKQKQTPFVRFYLQPQEPCEDVVAGSNDGIDFAKQEVYKDLYLTAKSVFMVTDMLDAVLGKQMGVYADERIPETTGARVMFQVGHRNSDDGSRSFYDIGAIVAA